jgi:hypothetical protein
LVLIFVWLFHLMRMMNTIRMLFFIGFLMVVICFSLYFYRDASIDAIYLVLSSERGIFVKVFVCFN